MRFVILWLLSWLLEVLAVVYFVYVALVYLDFLTVSPLAGFVPSQVVLGDFLRVALLCLGVVVGSEVARVLIAVERHLARVRYSIQHLRDDVQSGHDPFKKP